MITFNRILTAFKFCRTSGSFYVLIYIYMFRFVVALYDILVLGLKRQNDSQSQFNRKIYIKTVLEGMNLCRT